MELFSLKCDKKFRQSSVIFCQIIRTTWLAICKKYTHFRGHAHEKLCWVHSAIRRKTPRLLQMRTSRDWLSRPTKLDKPTLPRRRLHSIGMTCTKSLHTGRPTKHALIRSHINNIQLLTDNASNWTLDVVSVAYQQHACSSSLSTICPRITLAPTASRFRPVALQKKWEPRSPRGSFG